MGGNSGITGMFIEKPGVTGGTAGSEANDLETGVCTIVQLFVLTVTIGSIEELVA